MAKREKIQASNMLGGNFEMRISELEEKTLSESAVFEIEHFGENYDHRSGFLRRKASLLKR